MKIHLLSEETIGRIAAGEVVERPVNVVKELLENSIDAGATAVTCEIRDGGIKMIRVTDNGCGIAADQISGAFMRHATSKITDDSDLSNLTSLGFRGEALASIAAVSQVEMITKTRDSLTGIRATNQVLTGFDQNAPVKLDIEEIGAPDGTSVVVRNLFYNVPVRRKFLKLPQTEAGYITDLIQRQALSHPEISFHCRINGQEKLHTTGNGDLRELIYRIYGKEVSRCVIPIRCEEGNYRIEGFLGRPEISRGSRSFEVFFVNGRMLRSNLLSKALEAGYRTDLMKHRFPFAVLHLMIPPAEVDVNVHPTKMDVRFSDQMGIYQFLDENVHRVLHAQELIPKVRLESAREETERNREEQRQRQESFQMEPHPEPFEHSRFLKEDGTPYNATSVSSENRLSTANAKSADRTPVIVQTEDFLFEDKREDVRQEQAAYQETDPVSTDSGKAIVHHGIYEQASLFPGTDFSPNEEAHILEEENLPKFRIIGQVFETYWMVQYKDKLLVIDQHAAHEKVNYERLMNRLNQEQNSNVCSQMLAPPVVITLTGREEGELLTHREIFVRMGYEIDDLGESSYAIRAVPMELYGNDPGTLLRETLDEMAGEKLTGTPQSILAKIASMSCKAAVKGNSIISQAEAQALIEELLQLDNPYHCPHGRPTMVIFSQRDMDRKFKRIV